MTIQSWKHGVHTGNTIRKEGGYPYTFKAHRDFGFVKHRIPSYVPVDEAPKTKRCRQKRKKKTKKHQDTGSNLSSGFEVLENFAEDVFYSLNKKGRWNFPEQLREEIKTSLKERTRLTSYTTLIERDSSKLFPNCYTLYSTRHQGDRCFTKSETYTYINSESKLYRYNRLKRREKTKKSTNLESKEDFYLTEVEVEVFRPHPVSEFRSTGKIGKIHRARDDSVATAQKSLIGREILDAVNCFYDDECSNEDWRQDIHESYRRAGSEIREGAITCENESNYGKKPYIWFLEKFVTASKDDSVESDSDNEEDEKRGGSDEIDRNFLCDDDWEIINSDNSSQAEIQSGEVGLLGQLIDCALLRRACAESDSTSPRQKSKRRRSSKTISSSKISNKHRRTIHR